MDKEKRGVGCVDFLSARCKKNSSEKDGKCFSESTYLSLHLMAPDKLETIFYFKFWEGLQLKRLLSFALKDPPRGGIIKMSEECKVLLLEWHPKCTSEIHILGMLEEL